MTTSLVTNSAQSTQYQADLAVIVGRWQLFHKGHETLLHAALRCAAQVVVVVGSAYRARDVRNPFTATEREAMVRATLSASEQARVHFLAVRDYFDDVRWSQAARHGVEEWATIDHTREPCTIALVGFKKDHTSYYLDNFPQWRFFAVEQEVDIDATALRGIYFAASPTNPRDARWQALHPYVAPAVLDYLQTWSQSDAFAQRVQEQQAVQAYRARWTADAYLTADALVRAADHVLLIRRGGDIGKGLWALPGGFVEKNETFYQAAVRELGEETGLTTSSTALRAALQSSHVFDHPLRSPRGRIVTVAYYFDLGELPLPPVQGSDDAAQAHWFPIAELPSIEEQLFEDHAVILDRFVGVFAA